MIHRLLQRTCRPQNRGWFCFLLTPQLIGSSAAFGLQHAVSNRWPITSYFRAHSTGHEQEMTRHALEIVEEAIQAVDPYTAVKSHFRLLGDSTLEVGDSHFKLDDFDKIALVSFGKASTAMASAVLQQLEGNENEVVGSVICKDDHATKEEQKLLEKYGLRIFSASHPVPDERSAIAAEYTLKLMEKHASPSTLVLCCISGGGSALFCKPREGLTLKDFKEVNSCLLGSGMTIQEMNCIRKRLEDGKGGRLAAIGHPSQIVTLVLSDVLGDPLDLIASGPSVADSSSWKDAWEIVEKYQLAEKLPSNVLALMKDGKDMKLPDSPSPDHPVFETSKTVLVGNNALAVEAAAKKAEKLGYHPVVLGTQIEGESKEVANVYTRMALHLQQQKEKTSHTIAPGLPVAMIAGGETTVSLTSIMGLGGRNQELFLSAALQLEALKMSNVVLASAGTDGTDGPTDAAGAVVDATTVSGDVKAAQKALLNHDAYTYFDKLAQKENGQNALIKTGPTGTNVADICVTLIR